MRPLSVEAAEFSLGVVAPVDLAGITVFGRCRDEILGHCRGAFIGR